MIQMLPPNQTNFIQFISNILIAMFVSNDTLNAKMHWFCIHRSRISRFRKKVVWNFFRRRGERCEESELFKFNINFYL